jgi:endoglucanase
VHDNGDETGSAEWVGLPLDERVDLWTDAGAQEAFIGHGGLFAHDGLDDWRAIGEAGVGVVIGEFGVYNNTPHDVTLALLESKLQSFEDASFGWCMWNMSGEFGFFDCARSDVEYEDFRGMKLDRDMLELLQKY